MNNNNNKLSTKFKCVFIHGMFGWGKVSPLFNSLPSYWPQTIEELNSENFIVEVGVASSDHDRACETFFQLVGGTVDYGYEHSKQNHHERYGKTYSKPASFEWSKDCPIHLIGHSLGATTAIELYQLICDDFFGVGSSFEWIKSITCISGPLCGSTLTHSLGLTKDLQVRFFSIGYLLGLIAVLYWKLQSLFPYLYFLFDYRMPQWKKLNSWSHLLFHNHPYNLSGDNAFCNLAPKNRMNRNKLLKHMDKIYLFNVISDFHNILSPDKSNKYLELNDALSSKSIYKLNNSKNKITHNYAEKSFIAKWLSKYIAYECCNSLKLDLNFNLQNWIYNDGVVNLYSMLYPHTNLNHECFTYNENDFTTLSSSSVSLKREKKFMNEINNLKLQFIDVNHELNNNLACKLKKGVWSILHQKNKNHFCGTAQDSTSSFLYHNIFKVLKKVEGKD